MKQVPRYTSYPTAPHFHEGINGHIYETWLSDIPARDPLSLYIHIPFCAQLCWFCGCHTQVTNSNRHVGRYLSLLQQEIALIRDRLPARTVDNIHFGGGSPTIMLGEDFSRMMEILGSYFSISKGAEIAVEVDPRTVDSKKIDAYAKSGVTRASLGVQDFDAEVQIAINRIQPFELVEDVISNIRDAGIDSLNIDLIYGLPKQSLDSVKKTIERTLELMPDRISLFGYAHVPWMKKHQKLISESDLPDPELRQLMFESAAEMLTKEGYVAIGLDHFARKDDPLSLALANGTLRRNFQGYTTDSSKTLIGLGVSSISSLDAGYVQNTSHYVDYAKTLAAGELPIKRGISLSADDQLRREIIMSLMCNMRSAVPEDIFSKELDALAPYFNTGEAVYGDGILMISPKARPHMRLIASVFDRYLHGTSHLHAQAV